MEAVTALSTLEPYTPSKPFPSSGYDSVGLPWIMQPSVSVGEHISPSPASTHANSPQMESESQPHAERGAASGLVAMHSVRSDVSLAAYPFKSSASTSSCTIEPEQLRAEHDRLPHHVTFPASTITRSPDVRNVSESRTASAPEHAAVDCAEEGEVAPAPTQPRQGGRSVDSPGSAAVASHASAPTTALHMSPSDVALPSPYRARQRHCRGIEEFELLQTLGSGVYGVVSRARDRTSDEIVAVKHLKPSCMYERDGVPLIFLRELRALRALRHPNIVQLKEVVTGPPSTDNMMLGDVFMVFEFVPQDLERVASKAKGKLQPALVRSYMRQLLTALAFMEERKWTHRDLKPANILISADNTLKIADFGLARELDGQRHMTAEVVTLWYRAPELLYGYRAASFGVDVWSAGCVFAELLQGKPLFPAPDARRLIDGIYALCGVPSVTTWPGLRSCERYEALRPTKSYTPQFHAKFRGFDPVAIDLLSKLLTLSPHQRLTAAQALQHEYFSQLDPPAESISASAVPEIDATRGMKHNAGMTVPVGAVPVSAGTKRRREDGADADGDLAAAALVAESQSAAAPVNRVSAAVRGLLHRPQGAPAAGGAMARLAASALGRPGAFATARPVVAGQPEAPSAGASTSADAGSSMFLQPASRPFASSLRGRGRP